MAKTKADYIALGYKNRMDLHASGRKPEDVLATPVGEKVKSWQDTAYNDGWNKADEELKGNMTFERVSPFNEPIKDFVLHVPDDAAQHGRNMAEAGRGPSAKDVEIYAKSDYIPAPVLEHCFRLNQMAHKETNPGRCVRLRAKAMKLEAKYASRAARA